jgi:hypothetical protein
MGNAASGASTVKKLIGEIGCKTYIPSVFGKRDKINVVITNWVKANLIELFHFTLPQLFKFIAGFDRQSNIIAVYSQRLGSRSDAFERTARVYASNRARPPERAIIKNAIQKNDLACRSINRSLPS